MEYLPQILIFAEFAALTAMLGIAGFFLTLYGDVIAEKTGLAAPGWG
jgi:hypothetical protein